MLVISRLLHKKLSQRPKPPPYLDSVRNRLASLRSRLLARIDKRLQRPDVAGDSLIEAMCAFSLATSSSPTDVLRHLHHVRLEAMIQQGQEANDNGQGILQALEIFIKTLNDTRKHIPGQLANALQVLTSAPLFKSQDLQSLMELNLDVHGQWIGDDIKTFTPYIRHNDLQGLEASRVLKEWAEQALTSFFNQLRSNVQSIKDFTVLIQLRTHVFQHWFSNSQHSKGFQVSEVLEGLRTVFNNRLTRLIKIRTLSLEKLGLIVEETLQNWQIGSSDFCPSLWASSLTSMDISDGAKYFTTTLLERSQGKNEELQAISLEHTAWLQRIEAIEKLISGMRKIRWDDEIDAIEADDDLLDDKQILLSEDDPRILQDELRDSLENSYSSLQASIRKLVLELDGPDRGQQAVHLLRIWREIRQHVPISFRHSDLGLDSIPQLQEIVAEVAISGPLQACGKRLQKMQASRRVLGRPLWEGTPELPVLPSSWVFRLLHELVISMRTFGSDIWSPQATSILKRKLEIGLASQLGDSAPLVSQANGSVIEGLKDTETEPSDARKDSVTGENEKLTSGDMNADGKIQKIFDLLYLAHVTTQKRNTLEDNRLVLIQRSVEKEVELVEESMKRMVKQAEEYWTRTSLLLSLLA